MLSIIVIANCDFVYRCSSLTVLDKLHNEVNILKFLLVNTLETMVNFIEVYKYYDRLMLVYVHM